MKVNAPCVSTRANGGDWLRQEHPIYVCKHFTITLTEKRMKKFHARGKWQLPSSQYLKIS